jgi:hypothetical protein
MGVQVTINDITGQTPFNVFVCQSGGTGCFFMVTTSSLPYVFDIPEPYDTYDAYMIKIIDASNCIITGVTTVQ